MPRILAGAAVAIAAAVAVPSVAHGATIYQDGHRQRILFQDEAGETNLVSVEGSRSVVIQDANLPITVSRVRNCKRLDTHTVRCVRVRHLDLDLGDGPDVAHIASPLDIDLEGGHGRDRYVAGATDTPSRVDFSGGIGLDTANYFFSTAGVHVSVDLAADDGRAGDADRIGDDVEAIIGSEFADVLAGSRYTLQLTGGDGDDRITGGSGEEILAGGSGNDRIDARDGVPDTVDCGGQLLDWAAVDLAADASITGCAEVTS